MRTVQNIIIMIFLTLQSAYSQIKEPSIKSFISNYVKINVQKSALVNAKLIDGTGSFSKENQTVLIENEKILEIGNTREVYIPNDFHEFDFSGKTIIPGIVGTHNHMRLPSCNAIYFSQNVFSLWSYNDSNLWNY